MRQDPNFKNAEIRYLPHQVNLGGELMSNYRGSKPHLSHDDPNDTEEVISVRLKDGDNKTMQRAHVHLDGSANKISVG